jgi:hypothetical protein
MNGRFFVDKNMNERRIFNSNFANDLTMAGYPVKDLEAEIFCGQTKQKSGTVRTLRRWTGLPNEAIKSGLYNETQAIAMPIIENEIKSILKPWINSKTDEDLPELQVVEIARATEMSPEKVIDALSRYPVRIPINGRTFTTVMQIPEFPKKNVELNDSSKYGVSPKRIVKDARYLSRPPGGGAVQKARIQEVKIDGLIRRDARKKAKIKFIPLDSLAPDEMAVGAMKELEVGDIKSTKGKQVEKIIYYEPDGKDIMSIYNYLKEAGSGKNWLLGENEEMLAEALVSFSRGVPTDFIIWNCLAFKWSQTSPGSFPICEINDSLDTAISIYNMDRLGRIMKMLSGIGNPELTVLIPSSEAFDERLWEFSQSFQAREEVVSRAVNGINASFSSMPLFANAGVRAMRWDEYLVSRGAKMTAQDYSISGESKLRKSANFNKILKESEASGRSYFAQNGISNIASDILGEQQLRFYGLYAGEGIAFQEIQENGRNVIVINFEEMRAAQLTYLGADANLPIITPISGKEMSDYYKWKADKIKKRK